MNSLNEIIIDQNDSEDISLRPKTLNEYIGQSSLKENLSVFIEAALKRNEVLDHVLLYGPAGLGKTTLSNIIANEMGSKIHFASGPSIEKTGDLAAILNELEAGDILFIDEIHRIPQVVEETLYSAMEDFTLSIIINREINAKSLTINLPPFTLIGATTKAGLLSVPLRARFGITEKINYYTDEELKNIIIRSAKVFNIEIEQSAALEIAKRSRGIPRIANNIFKRCRDFSIHQNLNKITLSDVVKSLKKLKIDSLGLAEVDINYLKILINRFDGGPVGLETLACSIGEEQTNLEDVIEPYLIRIGLVDKTPKGRIATKKAYKHLNTDLS